MAVRNFIARASKFRKRVKTLLLASALIILVATLLKKGLIGALMKTRLVRALAKLLFNYDLGGGIRAAKV